MKINLNELTLYLAENVNFDDLFVSSTDSFDYFDVIIKEFIKDKKKQMDRFKK